MLCFDFVSIYDECLIFEDIQTLLPFLSLFPIYLVPLHSVKFESKI